MMPPCLTLSIIRYGSRVKWSNPGKGVVPSPIHWCSSYRKGSLRVTLDYRRQLYLLIYTGVGQNNGNIWKFQTNLFQYGFLIVAALLWNLSLCGSLLKVLLETGLSRWSLSSAVIFRVVFRWSFLTIHARVRQYPSDSFHFLLEICFCSEVSLFSLSRDSIPY